MPQGSGYGQGSLGCFFPPGQWRWASSIRALAWAYLGARRDLVCLRGLNAVLRGWPSSGGGGGGNLVGWSWKRSAGACRCTRGGAAKAPSPPSLPPSPPVDGAAAESHPQPGGLRGGGRPGRRGGGAAPAVRRSGAGRGGHPGTMAAAAEELVGRRGRAPEPGPGPGSPVGRLGGGEGSPGGGGGRRVFSPAGEFREFSRRQLRDMERLFRQ